MSSRDVGTIGILGGGQLGRMLAVAASRLGLRTWIFAPDADPVAAQVANRTTTADYDDAAALAEFAEGVDVATYEFENVPAEALDALELKGKLLPSRRALTVSQDRLTEKDFLNDLGLTTAPYANVEKESDVAEAVALVAGPWILKTRRLGYDGKGQARVSSATEVAEAWSALGEAPCILEGLVAFTREISVIAARSQDGGVVCFEPGENVHRDGILRTTAVPAGITDAERAAAVEIARTIVDGLRYVGVAGIELFVAADGVYVNEIAPRVHNSGHWTQNGCVIDQFEQHIRAIAGWQLGDGSRHSDVLMTNLIGDEVLEVPDLSRDPRLALHLYGKTEVRSGRKMGHVNQITGPAA